MVTAGLFRPSFFYVYPLHYTLFYFKVFINFALNYGIVFCFFKREKRCP